MTDSNSNPYASSKPMTPESEKLWSVAVHLLGIPFEFFAPLVGYLVFRKSGPFISHHVKESINFGITMVIVAIVMAISIIGWAFFWVLPIYWTILRIIAAVKASQGEFFRYPLTIRIINN